FTNSAAATLNVTPSGGSAQGAKSIRKWTIAGESALGGNEIVNGGAYSVVYDSTLNSSAGGFLLLNPTTAAPTTIPTTTTSPSNPAGTTDGTGVMMGLARALTPTTTGVVFVLFYGMMNASAGGGTITTRARYGTGTAPTNGAAATGTTIG